MTTCARRYQLQPAETKYHYMPGARMQTVLLLTLLLIAWSFGCSSITRRGQSPDVEGMKLSDDLEHGTYIGDVAGPVGLGYQKVEGLGLVTGLEGTGSDPPPSPQRDYLVDEIKTHRVDNVNDLLADPDNSMVQVIGMIPPAAQKGDRFDVYIKCMSKSKTTSLEGGFLLSARLKPMMITRRSVESGHVAGAAEGRVLVDRVFDNKDGDANLLTAVIPGGGIVYRERECGLQLLETARSIRTSHTIGKVINDRFRTRVGGAPEGVANPVSDRRMEILVPDEYRHNIGRYFHVMLNLVFDETAQQRINRLELLERQLHDPEKSSLAAIRLEAIGDDAEGALKRGLRSKDFQVQFHSAQALAYMRKNDGVDILRQAAAERPELRWHALTALASVRDGTSEKAFSQLFDCESAEARYGAFRSLRDSMPASPLVDGEFINREFMVHSVPSTAKPMVHFSRADVSEIVIFGREHAFNDLLLFVDKGLTIRSTGPGQVGLTRYLAGSEPARQQCSSRLPDVIRTAAAMGCDYGDILKLVKEASAAGALDTRVTVNAVPVLNREVHETASTSIDEEESDSESGWKLFGFGSNKSDAAESGGDGEAGTERKPRGVFAKMRGTDSR